MEAAFLPGLFADRRERDSLRQLEDLRPLGEAFVLRRYGHSLDRADAEDAVAEVIIRIHRRIAAGEGPDNLRAAFFTSARNAAIDLLRSRSAKPTVGLEAVAEAPAPQRAPSELAEAHDDASRIREALARMRPNYREAIVLRFGAGLTVPEIARRQGISLPAAKKLVLRATEQARKRLVAIEGEEFCPEMQAKIGEAILDRELAGIAAEDEREALRSHLEHCGRCKSFLAHLDRGLHELGTAALLGTAGGGGGFGAQLPSIVDQLTSSLQAGASRLRVAAYKAGGVFQSADAGAAGALGGTAQKVAAVCATATATTATCLATGVVGPGVGAGVGASHTQSDPPSATSAPSDYQQPAEVQPAPLAPEPTEPAPNPEPSPAPQSEPPSPAVESTPSEAGAEEFGFESAPETTVPAEPESPAQASTDSAESSGGGESFGFGG